MAKTESYVPLTEQDISKLKKKNRIVIIGFLTFTIIAACFLYFFFWRDAAVIIKIFSFVFILFPIFIIWLFNRYIQKDIQFGKKRVVQGILKEKFEKTTTSGRSRGNSQSQTNYYFIIEDETLEVTQAQFKKFHDNAEIIIELTQSNSVLDLRLVHPGIEQPESELHPLKHQDHLITSMEGTEPFSSEDIAAITKIRNKRIINTLLISTIAGLVAYVGFIVLVAFVLISVPDITPGIGRFLYYGVISLIATGIVLLFYFRVFPYIKDLNNQQKRLIPTHVQDKEFSNVKLLSGNIKLTSSRGAFYYLVVDGKKYEVNPELYNSVEGGEGITLKLAKYSGIFLGISKRI